MKRQLHALLSEERFIQRKCCTAHVDMRLFLGAKAAGGEDG